MGCTIAGADHFLVGGNRPFANGTFGILFSIWGSALILASGWLPNAGNTLGNITIGLAALSTPFTPIVGLLVASGFHLYKKVSSSSKLLQSEFDLPSTGKLHCFELLGKKAESVFWYAIATLIAGAVIIEFFSVEGSHGEKGGAMQPTVLQHFYSSLL